MMTPLSHLLPPLPGFTAPQTYAAFPVWSGSTTAAAQFLAMPKKAAVKLWHRARDFDRGTHQAGKHGGAVGPAALQVLHALIFDFLNHRTGRLDPSYAAIAHRAGVCVRTVATALKHLRELGILNWVRRCAESWRDGQFMLEQETNAYGLLPESQWRGYRPPQEPPAPAQRRRCGRQGSSRASRQRSALGASVGHGEAAVSALPLPLRGSAFGSSRTVWPSRNTGAVTCSSRRRGCQRCGPPAAPPCRSSVPSRARRIPPQHGQGSAPCRADGQGGHECRIADAAGQWVRAALTGHPATWRWRAARLARRSRPDGRR